MIIRLMVHCGMRREEVSGVKVEKIDLQRRRISFLGKGRLSGIVSVPPEVLQDIKFFLAGRANGYLFPAKKKKNSPIALVQMNRIVSYVGKRAGLKSPNPKSRTVTKPAF
jgi:integrase